MTATAALAGTGTQTNIGTGSVMFAAALASCGEMADTGKGFKHYQRYSNLEIVLLD